MLAWLDAVTHPRLVLPPDASLPPRIKLKLNKKPMRANTSKDSRTLSESEIRRLGPYLTRLKGGNSFFVLNI